MFKGLFSRLSLFITSKIIIVSLPVIAIVSAIIWCPSIMEFQKKEVDKYSSFAEREANLVKKAIHFSMLRNQREQIEEVIESVSMMENTLWIRVTDKDDIVRVSSRKEEVGKKCPTDCTKLDHGDSRVIKEIGGKKALLCSIPIENMRTCYTAPCHFHREDERILGRVELALDYGEIYKGVMRQVITVASFGLFFTSTLSVILYILVRITILKRVILLSKAARKVAEGDLSVEVPLTREKDEIGQLSEVFNNMVIELRKKRELVDREINGYKQSLAQAQKMEAIGLLASGIAHDFNNILTGIIGFSEILLNGAQDETTRENLRRIISVAERGADLTRQILFIGRKVPPQKKPLNINTFVKDSFKMLRRMVEESIELNLSLKEEIPFINADPSQLTQVLMNLVVNARDAIMGSGTITIGTDDVIIDASYTIGHPEARPGQYVVLSVRDTGEGIPDEIKEKVFDPFFTTKEKGKGTGLGLSVTYNIVVSHDGWIGIYSERGKGTEISVYLPAIEVSDIEPEPIVPPPQEIPSKSPSRLILLVDDEDIIRDVGSSIIESIGYDVITAANGKEAVDIYSKKAAEIDLIIMDLVMPEMDGLNAFEEIRRINPDAKVVISSGYSLDKTDTLKEKGVSGFINKPYRVREMAELIKELLDENG